MPHLYIDMVSQPEVEATLRALESARAQVNRHKSALQIARSALDKAEVEAKELIDAAKIKAQSITDTQRAQVDKATRSLEQSEAMVREQEEALFIALQIIGMRIDKSLGRNPIDLSNDRDE